MRAFSLGSVCLRALVFSSAVPNTLSCSSRSILASLSPFTPCSAYILSKEAARSENWLSSAFNFVIVS